MSVTGSSVVDEGGCLEQRVLVPMPEGFYPASVQSVSSARVFGPVAGFLAAEVAPKQWTFIDSFSAPNGGSAFDEIRKFAELERATHLFLCKADSIRAANELCEQFRHSYKNFFERIDDVAA